jgi:hypothetical protein
VERFSSLADAAQETLILNYFDRGPPRCDRAYYSIFASYIWGENGDPCGFGIKIPGKNRVHKVFDRGIVCNDTESGSPHYGKHWRESPIADDIKVGLIGMGFLLSTNRNSKSIIESQGCFVRMKYQLFMLNKKACFFNKTCGY